MELGLQIARPRLLGERPPIYRMRLRRGGGGGAVSLISILRIRPAPFILLSRIFLI